MANPASQFVVDQLRPEGLGGRAGGVYQLTANSVSPTRLVGTDEVGMPIEETIPAAYHKSFVMPDGGINRIPLRTAAVFSMEPEAVRYENQVTADVLRAGAMPLDVCPYTFNYQHIVGGALAKPPAGVVDCGGAPNGCAHMQKIIEARLARSRAKHDAEQKRIETMGTEDAKRMMESMAAGVGEAIARHLDNKPAVKAPISRGMKSED